MTEPAQAAEGPATGAAHLALGLVSQATGALTDLVRAGAGQVDDPGAADGDDRGDAAVDVAVGLAFAAGEVGARAVDVSTRTAAGLWTMARGVASLPGVDVVTAPARSAVEAVATRGRAERAAAAATASRTVEVAIERTTADVVPAATDRLLEGTLQDLLAKVLPVALEGIQDDPQLLTGVVDSVLPSILPDVLDRLAQDPDALLPLVNAIVERVLPDVLDRLRDDPDGILAMVDVLLPRLLPSALDRIGQDPDALVGLVEAILPRLLDSVLPAALDQLNEDPTVVRNLVLDQSGGLATEMANTVRARTVAGDEIVDRIVRRVLRRPHHHRPAPEGALEVRQAGALGPGEAPTPPPPVEVPAADEVRP